MPTPYHTWIGGEGGGVRRLHTKCGLLFFERIKGRNGSKVGASGVLVLLAMPVSELRVVGGSHN